MAEQETQRERRVEQLRGYLDSMRHRVNDIAKESCFIVFEQNPDPAQTGALQSITGWLRPGRKATERESNRLVQFMFGEEGGFLMDLPPSTLSREEAKKIMGQREGFTFPGQASRAQDPLQKSYDYGQEKEAAEDAAFILFESWALPVSCRLYVSAESLGTGQSWEQREPLE